MDEHLNRHILENFDVSGTQNVSTQHINKTNAPSVLRGIDGSAFHFITVTGRDQEYIDHTLLNPEYITTPISNGVIIDFISNQDGSEAHQQAFINENLPTDIVFPNDEQERKLTASLLQLVNKQSPAKIPNEAPVIVTNKDIAALAPISDCHKNTPEVHNFLSIDEHQQLTQNLLNDHLFKLYQPTQSITATSTSSQMFNLPLPPLTPIRRPNLPSKNINDEQNVVIKKEFYDDLEELNRNNEILRTVPQPKVPKTLTKKSLPHKKRITKKLKIIDKAEADPGRAFPVSLSDEERTLSNSQFSCQLCGVISASQIEFFSHLKIHYEPTALESTMTVKVEETPTIEQLQDVDISSVIFSDNSLNHDKDNSHSALASKEDDNTEEDDHSLNKSTSQADEVEFSDPEDMLEGIRGVVQKSVDNDSTDEMDIIGKTWYNNSAFNGDINFKTDIDSTSNQNLGTSEENFSIFLKNELEKPDEDYDEIVLSSVPDVEIDNDKIDELNSEDNIISPTISTSVNSENEKEILCKKENSFAVEKKNKKLESKPQSTKSQRKTRTRKPIAIPTGSDDSIDDPFDITSGDDGKNKKPKIKCPKCDKLLNSTNALKYHDLSHTGERPHQCEQCGKSFFALSALKVHMRLHSGDKPYECEICKRAFRQWGDLKYHIISIHTDVRNFQCEFCGKAFARRYSLVIHRRIHTSERNYKCEFCSKTFRASSYLQNHRKVHTGEKPYPCKICGKKFRVSGDLKRHVNIHTRDKTKKGGGKNTLPSVPEQDQLTQETFIISEVNLVEGESEPASIELSIVKEERKLMENSMDADLVYSDENIFKTVPELDTPSLLGTIPIEEETTISHRLKRSISDDQSSSSKELSIKRSPSETEKSLGNKSTDDSSSAISVDLSKFLPKNTNYLCFW